MVIRVLVQISNRNVDKTFDYLVPSVYIPFIKVGIRVLVPFGNQVLEGFVLDIYDKYDGEFELKDIIEVVDKDVILNDELLELGRFISDSYLSTLISSYQVMLPKALKAKKGQNVNKKMETYLTLNQSYEDIKLNDKQTEIVLLLKKEKRVLKSRANLISISSVRTLIKKGIIKEEKEEVYRLNEEHFNEVKHPLTALQKTIVESIYSKIGTNTTFLLHGVTGSGKTEVYMELVEKLLLSDKSSIILVPEISLTKQIVSRFRSRFSSSIAILHSRLSDGEKYDEWRKIARGEVKIVIGARSAIFAPLSDLGVIIIDEEHTTSYKQDSNPKYHVLDIAQWRSKYHSCAVVLGSATPRLESYARAKKGNYELVEMDKRVNDKKLPTVSIVDMSQEMKKTRGHFSRELMNSMEEAFSNSKQVLLLLNRRGYSSFISCKNCGYVEKCPNCDITLTFHKSSNTLRCHYCGYGNKRRSICPECHEESITSLGVGTERIEEELGNLFPNRKVIRMDFDTTSKKGSHEKIINAFKNKEYDILLGTQMIAKGLDFPDVTLVGVINADTSLNIPDFRSSEYTFQLLSQVAGRSGRGDSEGKVVIQTFNPDHYAISYAKEHDFVGFYEKEMSIRRQLSYPPYYYLTSIKVLSSSYEMARDVSSKVSEYLKKELNSTIILGPSVANVFKVNNVYRFQIILKYKREDNLYNALSKLLDHYKTNNKVKIDIDFNPNRI